MGQEYHLQGKKTKRNRQREEKVSEGYVFSSLASVGNGRIVGGLFRGREG